MRLRDILFSLPFFGLLAHATQAETLELYVDADYSINAAAAQSIQMGFQTALSQVDNRLGGLDVRLVPMDHRGNTKRSHRTMQNFLRSDNALAMIGGIHSPPYLSYKDYINANRILTLLPWSAAGPVTRASDGAENWIFRLSVDDTLSGEYLVRESVDRKGCSRVTLLLLDTGWGRANHKMLTNALARRNMTAVSVQFFSAAIGKASAKSLAQEVRQKRPDCAILLSNWDNGSQIVNTLHAESVDVRIFSHWGIMGGQFARNVPHNVRSDFGLSLLQTCWLRREKENNPVLITALQDLAFDADSLAQLPAPTGFVHGYDLARVLIQAAAQVTDLPEWQGGDITQRRRVLRSALIDLKTPVDGILNRYDPPFRPYSRTQQDGHEALGADDLCMARFREDGLLEDAG